mgnify:CR=1 FL=1
MKRIRDFFINICRWFKNKSKKEKEIILPINIDEAFSTGKIFRYKDKKLDKVLSEVSAENHQYYVAPYNAITRALIVTSIKNQRHIDTINRRNGYLTILIIILTLVSIFLSFGQYKYSRIQAAPLLYQCKNQYEAKIYCENNQNGYWPDVFGKPMECKKVLEIIAKSKYKDCVK